MAERLGEVIATIEALKVQVRADAAAATVGRDALREEVRADAAQSKAAHDKIDRKVDAVFKRVGGMDDRLQAVERDAARVLPVVDRLAQNEQRWIGVRKTLLILWTGLTVIAGLAVGYIAGGGGADVPPENPPLSLPRAESLAGGQGQ